MIDVLWGDDLPRNPANALQIQVSYLRKVFANAEPTGARSSRPTGRLRPRSPKAHAIDVARFERRSRPAPSTPALSAAALSSALAEVDAALGLWRGEALEESRTWTSPR